MGKNLEIEIIILKYVLNYSESILPKTIFQKNFSLDFFLTENSRKQRFFE